MKKVFSLILGMLGLTLLLFTCNLNVNAVAANTIVKDGKTFEKVTSQAQVTEGNYIIGAKGNEMFAGNFNSKNYYEETSTVDQATVFNFSVNNDGYNIQNTTTGNYMYHSGKNTIYEGDASKAEKFAITIGTTTAIKFTSVGREIKYNKSATRFSSYTSGQIAIELFKEKSNTPELKEYIITLNTMGGDELAPITGYEGKTLTNLPVPVKPGFKFVGWYKEEGLVNPWNVETDVVTANMTLYAKWEESNLVQITKVEEVVSAKYILKANDKYVAKFSTDSFTATSLETEALEINIIKVGDKFRLSFMNGEVETYFVVSTNTAIKITDVKDNAYLSNIKLNTLGSFDVMLGNDRRIALNHGGTEFKAYSTKDTSSTPVELYKIKGSEMADEVTFVDEFVKTNTLASLKMTYNTESFTATDVDLRFGTLLKANAFDASAKYGVLLVRKEAGINFTSGKQTEATAVDFVNNHAGVKSLEAKNIARVDDNGVESETGNNYQFAWVVTNMEEVGYATELVAVTYVEYNGSLYLANQTSYSVKTLCQNYIDRKVPEVVENATVLKVFENIIKG